jgi:parvulin-like peptidyl-prolyl isomerase
MTRASLALLVSILLAFGAAELFLRSFWFRHWLGKITGRGELQVLVRQSGVYDRDVEQAWRAELYLRGTEPDEVGSMVADEEKGALLHRVIARAELEAASAHETVDQAELNRQLELIGWEYRDEKSRTRSLGRSGISTHTQEKIRNGLRASTWLEASIAARSQPNDSEIRSYFDEHSNHWQQPARWRASHLFLAAPQDSPTETIEGKRSLIRVLAQRLANGESFSALVAEFSEDETTRKRGGDLGYFGEKRMLPEIIDAVRQSQPGEITSPIQSRLGFHLLRVTERLSQHSLSYDEARPQIVIELQNQRRTRTVAQVLDALR